MNQCIRFPLVALCILVSIAAIWSQAFAEEFVINGDFETEAEEFIVWPGYVGGSNDAGDMNPDEVPEWLGTGQKHSTPRRSRLRHPGTDGRRAGAPERSLAQTHRRKGRRTNRKSAQRVLRQTRQALQAK